MNPTNSPIFIDNVISISVGDLSRDTIDDNFGYGITPIICGGGKISDTVTDSATISSATMSCYTPHGTGKKPTKHTDATVRVFKCANVLAASCGILETYDSSLHGS